jgi:predicted dehydrogenase
VAISGDVDSFGEFQLLLRDGDILSPRVPATEPLKVQLEHFFHCVRSGKEPLTPGRAGVDVVRVMEAIDLSLAAGGVPFHLEGIVRG